jgi:hypothetical protein
MTKTAPSVVAKPIAPPSVPPLAADLDAGLRRLKLAAVRRTAPEVLITAKTQRWTPEEVLRTLVETELAARDASNIVNRLKAAAFPVPKTVGDRRRHRILDPTQGIGLPLEPGMDTRTTEPGDHRASRGWLTLRSYPVPPNSSSS